jgi:hypothetical protein
MKKLRLELETLTVESFDTVWRREKGTVAAHGTHMGFSCDVGESCDGACGTFFCGTGASCDEFSCVDTCAHTGCTNCVQSANENQTCCVFATCSCRPG